LGKTPNPGKLFPDNLGFDKQLICIGQMLIMAAPTIREVAAARRDSCWGGFKYFKESCPRPALVTVHDFYMHPFAGKCEWHKNHSPLIIAS
jgi:hypothetical protein